MLIQWGNVTNLSFTRTNDNFAACLIPLNITYGNTKWAVSLEKNNYSNVEAELIAGVCPANGSAISFTLGSVNGKLTQNFLDTCVKSMIFSYITIGKKS